MIGWLLLLVGMSLFVVINERRANRNCRRHIDAWATREGMRVEAVRRLWVAVEWFWRSRAQRVFEVAVVDEQGKRRTAVLRVGGWWTGSWSDEVEARWR